MSGGDDDELDAGGGDENTHATGQKPDLPAAPIFDLSSEQAISANMSVLELSHPSRKEKRKHLKKLRRKQIRQQTAEEQKLEENAGLDDTALQLRIQLEEQIEAEALALEKAQHDEQERLWLEREEKAMEDFQRQREELEKLEEDRNHQDAEEELEYLEDDGPPEIIWKGNEIIVRKRRVKVLAGSPQALKDATQSTSNPLPPQSAAFAAHNKYLQTPEVHEKTGPMFGTEQDKTHCPFHIKTGVCRFGVRCSRVHVYPDQSFTLLIRNMYTGPGLAWENDEGLENSVEEAFKGDGKRFWWLDEGKRAANVHSDEEVAQHYGEFYEDVHSEFLRFGELVNFKVCKNESSHLRGNVYVHYQTEVGAQAAYSAMNGRFYAGKQITCEFVGVTRWRVALCGEYMKGHHRPCSHGTACNFLHCFRNPHGEYDWADWDSPCPRYWAAKMGKLFGYEIGPEQECDSEFSDGVRRRRRIARSPRQREYGHVDHRNRDRRPHWDDLEDSGNHRGRRRYEIRDDQYGSDSDDQRRSSRHQSHRSRNAHRLSTSEEVEERGGRNDRDAILDSHSSKNEPIPKASHDVKNDGRKRHKRHKPASHDGQVDEFSHESRRVSRRDISVSCHDSLQDSDKGTKHDSKWHISRALQDSDLRQSLDLRISRGRSSEIDSHTVQTESMIEDGSIEEKYYSKKGSDKRNRNKEWVRSYSDSSDSSDGDRSRRRQSNYDGRRHSGGQRRRGRKSSNKQFLAESEEKSPDKDDRWTGERDL